MIRHDEKRSARRRALGRGLGLLALAGAVAGEARGDGVAQVMTSKSLPEATVDVIDPESGTSSGTGGSDVRIAVGDIILFRFAFTPVPDKVNRGLQSWMTEYMPPNTEVVGVRIVDADGRTIEPRYPGLALDGCQPGACNTFSALPCQSGTCSFDPGTIAQVHADTGVFVTTDARLSPAPGDQFITMNNGIVMSPEPRSISPGIVALLGDTTGPYHAHNLWDWIQVRGYGVAGAASGNSGAGNTPFGYGSPVAGPDTFYRFEVTETSGGVLRFNDVVGPWQRVRYPGSLIGTGAASGTGAFTRTAIRTSAGLDLRPSNPVAATAIRIALGETRTGEPGFVEVALRVTGVPIDPSFGTGGANVDCGEVVGSDIASRGGNSGSKDNPWPSYVASPACVFLRLLFDLDVDKTLAVGNDLLAYTLRGKNLAVTAETGAVARLKFDPSRQSFVDATPPATSVTTCADDTTKTCVLWSLGTLEPSQEYVREARFRVGGGGQTTNVVEANYTSGQLLAPGFSTQALTIVTGIAVPRATLGLGYDPAAAFPAAGATAAVTGAISNLGTASWSQSALSLILPPGWTVNGSTVTLGGTTETCDADCTTSSPRFDLNLVYTRDQARALAFTVRVPAGTPAGLYPIDVQTLGSQSGFGGTFETYTPRAVFVNVGARRSQAPVIACPVVSTAPQISGTSEAGAAIEVLFNLLTRATATADGAGAWSASNYQAFGEMYGGLELQATAQAPSELPSERSAPCVVTGVRACSDGIDNDGDGGIDFPADLGCDSPGDNNEIDPAPAQCGDGIDNDGDGRVDWPADSGCAGSFDPVEDDVAACANGIDDDGDGRIDFPADPDCTSASDGAEVFYAACQNGIDDDGDGRVDVAGVGSASADPGCYSAFDRDEADVGSSPLDTKARVLLAFDSSGSMNWHTCADQFSGGDGTAECRGSDVPCAVCASSSCGNGVDDDSRLAKVKAGIGDAVAAFGEIEYALMRFHQRAETFTCPGPSASLRAGGWQGGGAAPCSGGFAAGDLLVSFADDNEGTLLDWINGSSDYDGVPPPGTDHEIRGSGTTPLAGILSSARTYLEQVRAGDSRGACRPYQVILVTDGGETCGGDPVARAGELASAGIRVHVIGFATPDLDVIANLDAIAVGGGTEGAIFVDDEAALSQAIAAIVTESILVELCNGDDDDCDSRIDEDFATVGQGCDNGEVGVCRQDGTHVCRPDGLGTTCDAPPGTPGSELCNNADDDCDRLVDENLPGCDCVPNAEICNGRDDDCDGTVDEGDLPGVGDDCGLDIGACEPGVLACIGDRLQCSGGQGPVDETCNRSDDDCDTFVDEYYEECYTPATGCTLGVGCQGSCRTGVRTCDPDGSVTECTGEIGPGVETCNGSDDDCDGRSDETYPGVGGACDNGQLGSCRLTGVVVCTADGAGSLCTAPPVPPGIETCNGADDDCDGRTDEALGAPVGQRCGGGAGCSVGTFACVDGEIRCEGSVGGSAETCNGADDDCDSLIDEAPLPGTGADCTAAGSEEVGDTGECTFGATVCAGGQIVCSGYTGPRPEICNGLDDDCDGSGDEMVTCPGADQTCIAGECAVACAGDEFPCSFGFRCVDDYCLRDPCADVTCQPGWACNSDSGQCYDLCDGVVCPTGRSCVLGVCRDCFVVGCPSGERCQRNDTGIAECRVDACAGVSCGTGEFCRDGTCVAIACEPACATGQTCRDGTCLVDPCADTRCSAGDICRPSDGACIDDPCGAVSCPGGVCRPSDGRCIADPCQAIECPVGTSCAVTYDGIATCAVAPSEPIQQVTAAGSGCGCSTSRDAAATGWLVLGLLALRWRRGRGDRRR